jgi:hypothetical protein
MANIAPSLAVSPPWESRLEQNVALEDVQYLAGHPDLRKTRLYVRRRRKVTRNIVERTFQSTLSKSEGAHFVRSSQSGSSASVG